MNARPIKLLLSACLAIPLCARAELVDATLYWATRAVLGVPVSGVIEQVPVVAGQRVRKGETLVSLDPRPFRLALQAARARVERLVPDIDEARRELARARDLYDRTVLSDHELQLAKIALARLVAERRVAEAKLAGARLEVEWSVLRAPFDGIVVEQHAVPGQSVAAELRITPLVVLGSAPRLRARSYLPAARLVGLERGNKITVLIDGQRIDGVIDVLGVEPVADSGDHVPRYALDVLFEPSAEVGSRIGAKVRIELP